MRYVFLDTETSDLNPGQICQLSMIVINDGKMSAKNYFFTVDKVELGAQNVHGFSVERLRELSKGCKFNMITQELLPVLMGDDAILICHNVDFDYKFLFTELKRCGVFLNMRKFCTMKYFTDIIQIPSQYKHGEYKWPRLSELLEFLIISDAEVIKEAQNIFGATDIGFHDARFDTAGLFLAYKKAKVMKFDLP